MVADVGERLPFTDLVRFRLHTWPTVSINLCPREVQIAYVLGLLSPRTSALLRFRLHARPTVSTNQGDGSRSMRQSAPFFRLAIGEKNRAHLPHLFTLVFNILEVT